MNVVLLVRQSLRESWRNRELPGLVGLFVVIFGLLGVVFNEFIASDAWTMERFMLVPLAICSLLVPMIGIVLGNNAVTEPRASGRLRLVLGQPISRVSYLFATYVAKAVILTFALLAAGVAFNAVAVGLGAPLEVGLFFEFILLTIPLGIAYVGTAVAVSGLYRTTDWTTFTMFSVFVIFLVIWRLVPAGVLFVTNGFGFPESEPAWVTIGEAVSPSVAYEYLFDFYVVKDAAISTPDGVGGPVLYAGMLLAWIVVVPVIAAVWFQRTDL